MHRGYSEKLSGVGTPPPPITRLYVIVYIILYHVCILALLILVVLVHPSQYTLRPPQYKIGSYSTVTTTGAQDVAVHLAVVVLHP